MGLYLQTTIRAKTDRKGVRKRDPLPSADDRDDAFTMLVLAVTLPCCDDLAAQICDRRVFASFTSENAFVVANDLDACTAQHGQSDNYFYD